MPLQLPPVKLLLFRLYTHAQERKIEALVEVPIEPVGLEDFLAAAPNAEGKS